MAENYKIGKQRIRYRSRQFKEGKTVTMDILNPSLNWTNGILFTEVGKGVYFLDFDFSQEGTYTALLYEDGEKSTSQNFYISKEEGQLSISTISIFRGPSVINN